MAKVRVRVWVRVWVRVRVRIRARVTLSARGSLRVFAVFIGETLIALTLTDLTHFANLGTVEAIFRTGVVPLTRRIAMRIVATLRIIITLHTGVRSRIAHGGIGKFFAVRVVETLAA